MSTQPQVWKGTAFSIERIEGDKPGTLIFRLTGPFTARDRYGSLTPLALSNMLDFQSAPDEKPPAVNVLDLTGVPYMDSTGLGMVVTHFARCQAKGIRMVAIGVSPRVLELFRMTKVDGAIPMAAGLEDLDA